MGDLAARYSACEKAFMSKDVDTYITFFSENIEMWGPHGQPVVGKPAVTEAFRAMIPALDVTEVKELKVEEMGEFGFVTCRTVIQGANFKNMLLWRKEGGNWLIFRDIFSSADPAPEGQP